MHLLWLKRDLRISDHAALYHAAKQGHAVLPVYIVEPDYWQQPDTSLRHWAFISDALLDLQRQFSELGQPLLVFYGPASRVFSELLQCFPISAVYSHEETGNLWSYQRDLAVGRFWQQRGIPWHQFKQFAIFRPLPNRDFWFKHAEDWLSAALYPTPKSLPFICATNWQAPLLSPERYHDLALCSQPQHAKHLTTTLQSFLSERAQYYRGSISYAAKASHNCSRLSPYLSYGMLSMRTLQQQSWLQRCEASSDRHKQGLDAFYSRLRWHCHFMQKLEDEPEIEFRNMHRGFDGLREQDFSKTYFHAWATGTTGYPLIDAAMRSLLHTGWLHFRGRAMLVAFACYHLWLHWRPVALHLARCFVDYEPGIHYPQIQMQAGTTGINPNRMYNPIKQSMQKDAEGQFIRKWLPELRLIPTSWLHQPWLLNKQQQQQYGCVLGRDYPEPIVEAEQAMRLARQRLKVWLAANRSCWSDEKKRILVRHASRNRPVELRKKISKQQLALFDD